MFIDAAAIIAILSDEPEADRCSRAIAAAKTATTALQEPVRARSQGAIVGKTIEPIAPDVFIRLKTWRVSRPPRSMVRA